MDLYLQCYSENEIMEELMRRGIEITQVGVHKKIKVITQRHLSNSYNPPGCLQIYNVWKTFSLNKDQLRYPGQIPEELKEDWEIEEQLIKDNLLRRHLTTAQKAEIVLKLAEIEAKKARERQLSQLKQFRNTVEGSQPPTDRYSVEGSQPTTEDSGRAIEIAVRKVRSGGLSISDKTVKKAKKILEVAENDPMVAEWWEEARQGRRTVEEVYTYV